MPEIISNRICPECRGRRFHEAYKEGWYFILCETCGHNAMFDRADDAVAAWCEEVEA